MKYKFLAELKEFVDSGLPQVQLERPNPLWKKIRSSIPTAAEMQNRFEQALKTIPYPYPDSRHLQSTFDVLAGRNLLKSILAPEVFGKLFIKHRAVSLLWGLVDLRKVPKQGYGWRFHEDMIKLMIRHIREIKTALSNAGVAEEWAKEALNGNLTQLGKDLRLLYPYYPDTDFPPQSIGTQIVAEYILDTYKIFSAVLNRRKARGARMLAAHLTAIFCTPPNLLRAGKLGPSPEAIRKLLVRRSKRKRTSDNS